jgi:hypothetical protein
VIRCGSTFGILLRFTGSSSLSKSFRFDVVVIGDAVLFVHRRSPQTKLIKDPRGFGLTFLGAYTTWDLDIMDGFSHQLVYCPIRNR